ncbi:MAG: MBL fold metallo-hydrolase [Proteobacteria bacterium]|nr:MBL fold metallo-hydrolase [Pseudomonadota bacterium]
MLPNHHQRLPAHVLQAQIARLKAPVPLKFEYNRTLAYGHVEWCTPDIRRVLCNNPGPMTERGTNTWIVGRGEVTVIDPGPDDPAHRAGLLNATAGERIGRILVTHTHRDHSAGATMLANLTGAATFGFGRHPTYAGGDDGADQAFCPDHRLIHGERILLGSHAVTSLHTPGHCSTHLCFALEPGGVLFTGDHVLGWATTAMKLPDGCMKSYLRSLEVLTDRTDQIYLPGHGPPIVDPLSVARGMAQFARAREARIITILGSSSVATAVEVATQMYRGPIDPVLAKSVVELVNVHLAKLHDEGLVAYIDGAGGQAQWRLVAKGMA